MGKEQMHTWVPELSEVRPFSVGALAQPTSRLKPLMDIECNKQGPWSHTLMTAVTGLEPSSGGPSLLAMTTVLLFVGLYCRIAHLYPLLRMRWCSSEVGPVRFTLHAGACGVLLLLPFAHVCSKL